MNIYVTNGFMKNIFIKLANVKKNGLLCKY